MGGIERTLQAHRLSEPSDASATLQNHQERNATSDGLQLP